MLWGPGLGSDSYELGQFVGSWSDVQVLTWLTTIKKMPSMFTCKNYYSFYGGSKKQAISAMPFVPLHLLGSCMNTNLGEVQTMNRFIIHVTPRPAWTFIFSSFIFIVHAYLYLSVPLWSWWYLCRGLYVKVRSEEVILIHLLAALLKSSRTYRVTEPKCKVLKLISFEKCNICNINSYWDIASKTAFYLNHASLFFFYIDHELYIYCQLYRISGGKS